METIEGSKHPEEEKSTTSLETIIEEKMSEESFEKVDVSEVDKGYEGDEGHEGDDEAESSSWEDIDTSSTQEFSDSETDESYEFSNQSKKIVLGKWQPVQSAVDAQSTIKFENLNLKQTEDAVEVEQFVEQVQEVVRPNIVEYLRALIDQIDQRGIMMPVFNRLIVLIEEMLAYFGFQDEFGWEILVIFFPLAMIQIGILIYIINYFFNV